MSFENVKNQLYTHYVQQNWTEREFAEKMGISMQHVRRIWALEAGYTLSLVQKMANAMNLELQIRIDTHKDESK